LNKSGDGWTRLVLLEIQLATGTFDGEELVEDDEPG